MSSSIRPLLTVKEVAAVLRTNTATVYGLKNQGRLRFIKIGQWKCRPEDLERFLEGETE